MSYRRAEQILPMEIIEMIQDYIDGECIYIPRKENARRVWGEKTQIRAELGKRNQSIYADYLKGDSVLVLADRYCLSDKSIQRILRQMKQVV